MRSLRKRTVVTVVLGSGKASAVERALGIFLSISRLLMTYECHFVSPMRRETRKRNTHKIVLGYRGRKRVMKASERINDGARTPCAGATAAVQVDDAIASTSTLDWIDFDYYRHIKQLVQVCYYV
ncbi:hypothetical protein EVAR_96762_1 [Eumeta japonica]|uniref:Uncharacterized protein n=1 Tax=Eumeta variegata TaxID=151549 RepID=A0A4C1WUR8_EUMVA|nr:hypothetical protein EVAR_96762_1 [Eumeta japonica]